MIDLVKIAEEGARRVGESFTNPDDDWAPALIVANKDEHLTAALIEIGVNKDRAADKIVSFLRAAEAVDAAFVVSSWGRTARSMEDAESGPSPSQHPDRVELLVITHVNHEVTEMTTAEITRHKDGPPTLGEFSPMVQGDNVSGRFIDALRMGIG